MTIAEIKALATTIKNETVEDANSATRIGTALFEAVNALEALNNTEANARIAADNALQANITAETNARIAADNTLTAAAEMALVLAL